MSVLAPEIEIVEGVVPTSTDLVLVESVVIEEGAIQDDGSVLLNLIRPCVGKGRGRHLYTAQMLEGNADKFTGWKMYLNHLSEAARRALGGLPRDVRDVGGIVDTSWWDGDVPAEGRFGKGAVVGKVKPVSLIRELIAVDPRLVECSINATATGVKPGQVGTERVWAVEGISNEPPGSVDWVTEAGAGGHVRGLMESVYGADSPVDEFLDGLSYDDMISYLKDSRPDLVEAVARRKTRGAKPSGDAADDGDDEQKKLDDLVKKFVAKGMPEAAARKAAQKALSSQESTDHEGERVAELTPEEIRAAIESDDGQTAIAEAVRREIQSLNLGDRVVSLVEGSLDEEREKIREAEEARATRRAELHDLRGYAHTFIEETKLTPKLKESLSRRFDLVEGKPTPELDIVSDEDETGSVTKSAREKLAESLKTAVQEGYDILAEAAPTRVRGQGPRDLRESADEPKLDADGKPVEPTLDDKVGARTAQLLREAGISDPEAALKITPESVLARQGIGG